MKPNFLVIGANKGGTTSLYHYLTAHPEVFKPAIKEPMFFNHYLSEGEDGEFRAQKVIKTKTSYAKLFEGSENFKAAGEFSTSYLANPYCAENIYDFNPKMKLIAILRNPIERAFSNYLMYVRWGEETRSFSRALRDVLEGKELPQGKQYIYLGHYLESLKTYRDKFGENQLLVLINEDLRRDAVGTFRSICDYLEVDSNFVPDFKKKYNTNDSVEIRSFHKFLKKLDGKLNYTRLMSSNIRSYVYSKPKMKQRDKDLLKTLYGEEIKALSVFLNRDLSHWML